MAFGRTALLNVYYEKSAVHVLILSREVPKQLTSLVVTGTLCKLASTASKKNLCGGKAKSKLRRAFSENAHYGAFNEVSSPM